MASPRPQGLSPSKKQTNEKPSDSLLAFNQIKPQGLEPQVPILPLLLATLSPALGLWANGFAHWASISFSAVVVGEFPIFWGVYKD